MIDVIEVERAAEGEPPRAPRGRGALLAAALGVAVLGGALVAPSLLGEGSGFDFVRSVETSPATTLAPTGDGPSSTLPSEPDAQSAEPASDTAAEAVDDDVRSGAQPTFVEVVGGDGDAPTADGFDDAADGDGLAPARRERHATQTDSSTDAGSSDDGRTGDPNDVPGNGESAAGVVPETTPAIASNGDTTATTQPAPTAPTTVGSAESDPASDSAADPSPTSAPATSIVPDEVADAAGGDPSDGSDVVSSERPPEAAIIGSIAFPSLGLDYTLREGIQQSTIDLGPSHWPGTAMPGEVGNVVIAGHRSSHGGPFRHLHELEVGDVVSFDRGDGPVDYVMVGSEIVGPDALWIVDPTDTPTATLFSCHPIGSTAERIVIHLELVE